MNSTCEYVNISDIGDVGSQERNIKITHKILWEHILYFFIIFLFPLSVTLDLIKLPVFLLWQSTRKSTLLCKESLPFILEVWTQKK